jgi:hypothetical protein
MSRRHTNSIANRLSPPSINTAIYAAAQASQAAIAYGEHTLLRRQEQYASAFMAPVAAFSSTRSSELHESGSTHAVAES